jgi:predicted nuclease with TOPRIM domain
MIKIEGNRDLVRDETSQAVINTDVQAFSRARQLKSRIRTQDKEINTLKEEVNEMKSILLQINERLKWQEQ